MSPFQPWAHGLDEIRFEADDDGFGAQVLAELLDNVPVAIAVTLGPHHRYSFTNRLFRSVWLGEGESPIGKTVSEVMGDGYTPQIQALRQEVFETGEPCELTACPMLLKPGHEPTYWDIKLLPVRHEGDQVRGILTLAANVTERVKARSEAARQAQEADLYNERLALAVEATELGLWEWDVRTNATYWSHRQKEIFGLPENEPSIYEFWLSSLHPEDRERVTSSVFALLDPGSGGQLQLEHRIIRPDSEIRCIISRGRMLYEIVDGALKAVRLLGTIFDITERRQNEEARQLLVQELDHRVKNLFAMASGMVALTARTAATPKEMATSLQGRLEALARAHELIRPAITGGAIAGMEASLDEIVQAVLAPHADDASSRMSMGGAPLPVGPKAATVLTLVLHELATNAAKYGALSVHDGHLRIGWSQNEADLMVEWHEENGPTIAGAPESEGFGSKLARKSVTDQLGGEIVHGWRPEGLHVRIRLPLGQLSQG